MIDIVGVTWLWQAFQDQAEANDIVAPDPQRYALTLQVDGTAAIQADCNRVAGFVVRIGMRCIQRTIKRLTGHGAGIGFGFLDGRDQTLFFALDHRLWKIRPLQHARQDIDRGRFFAGSRHPRERSGGAFPA